MTKTVTRISTQKRSGRYNLDLDGEFAFGISNTTFVKFVLFKGTQLTDQQIKEIRQFDQVVVLKEKALNFISVQIRSKKEVIDKLKGLKDVDAHNIEQVVSDLEKQGIIDDQKFAQALVNTQIRLSNDGPFAIRQKLIKKGVSTSVIEKALTVYDEQTQKEHMQNLAEKMLRSELKRNSPVKTKQKIYQNLAAKGFASGLVKEIVDQLAVESTDDYQKDLIRKQLQRIWERYEKYGRDRRYKAKQFLYVKGFNVDLIEEVLNEYE